MKKILVVDDELLVLKILRRALQNEGYELFTAETGKEALKISQDKAPDLVITDIYIPDMDGLEIIQKLKKMHPHLKFIAMSGGGIYNNDMLPQAELMGANLTVEKPIDMVELLMAVNVLLP